MKSIYKNFLLAFTLSYLGFYSSLAYSQKNTICKAEGEALRALNKYTKIQHCHRAYDAIMNYTKGLDQELFGGTHMSLDCNVNFNFYHRGDNSENGHLFQFSQIRNSYDVADEISFSFTIHLPSNPKLIHEKFNKQLKLAQDQPEKNSLITQCGFKGILTKDASDEIIAVRYFDFENNISASIEKLRGKPDVKSWANKICNGFKNHGIHNLVDYLLSLPYHDGPQPATTTQVTTTTQVEEPLKDPLMVSLELIDTDNQFTLADEAILELTVTNATNEPLNDLVFELNVLKEKVTTVESDLRPSHYKTLENILLWEPGVKLKTTEDSFEFMGYPTMKSLPFTLQGKEQRTYKMVIKSGPEDNAWIYNRMLFNNESPFINDLLKLNVSNKDQGILFNKPININFQGKEAQLVYPKFSTAATHIPDQQHLDYYLSGDKNFSEQNLPYLKLLACKAARYTRSDYKSTNGGWKLTGTEYISHITIPEKESQIVENIANYVYDVFSYKNWPEPLWKPIEHATNILNETYGLGKVIHHFPRGKGEFVVRSLLGQDVEKTGIACIEHAYFFGNLTRYLGFPTREINCLNYIIPGKGSQDASSEVFYRNSESGNYEWQYYSLFTDTGAPIRDPYERYGFSDFYGTFLLWYGVNSDFNDGPKNNRFLMSPEEMNNSDLWKFYARGRGGSTTYNLKYEDIYPKRVESRLELTALSPLTMYLDLPDGKSIGSKNALSMTDDLKHQFVMNNLSEENKMRFFPFEGATYLPEGIPLIKTVSPYIEDSDQTIILPEKYVHLLEDIDLQLYGTGTGNYTLQMSVIDNGIQRIYKDIKGHITKGELKKIRLNSFQIDSSSELPDVDNVSVDTQEPVLSSILNNNTLSQKNLIYALLISLGLNILFVGLFIGRGLRKGKSKPK